MFNMLEMFAFRPTECAFLQCNERVSMHLLQKEHLCRNQSCPDCSSAEHCTQQEIVEHQQQCKNFEDRMHGIHAAIEQCKKQFHPHHMTSLQLMQHIAQFNDFVQKIQANLPSQVNT